jgi:hypothetical protein
MTMTLISTTTVGSGGATEITFSSIPQTYTDLYLVVSARSTGSTTNETVILKFNGVTTNQTSRSLLGDGGSASSPAYSNLLIRDIPGASSTSNTFGSSSIYIPNYAGSTNKSVSVDHVNENNSTNAYFQDIFAGLWSSTAAITSVTYKPNDGGNLAQYSTASLYGILKGSGGATVS